MLEVRDLSKGGKTTAVIMTGGIEENGPYPTTGKHNNVLRQPDAGGKNDRERQEDRRVPRRENDRGSQAIDRW